MNTYTPLYNIVYALLHMIVRYSAQIRKVWARVIRMDKSVYPRKKTHVQVCTKNTCSYISCVTHRQKL